MSVEQEILVTGIKVVDLLAPYAKGGKIGMSSVVYYVLCIFVLPVMMILTVDFRSSEIT